MNPAEFPEWSFDGSSTGQADGNKSDCILRPVFVVRGACARVEGGRAGRGPHESCTQLSGASVQVAAHPDQQPTSSLACSAPTRSAAATTCW